MKAKPPARGIARMKELGYTRIQLFLDEREVKAVQAVEPGKPLAVIVRKLVCRGANTPFYHRR